MTDYVKTLAHALEMWWFDLWSPRAHGQPGLYGTMWDVPKRQSQAYRLRLLLKALQGQ